jgi:hypothetical protein
VSFSAGDTPGGHGIQADDGDGEPGHHGQRGRGKWHVGGGDAVGEDQVNERPKRQRNIADDSRVHLDQDVQQALEEPFVQVDPSERVFAHSHRADRESAGDQPRHDHGAVDQVGGAAHAPRGDVDPHAEHFQRQERQHQAREAKRQATQIG